MTVLSAGTKLTILTCLALGAPACKRDSECDLAKQHVPGAGETICNRDFVALAFDGNHSPVVKVAGYSRFFMIDGHTPDAAIDSLKWRTRSEGYFTGYKGSLDGKIIYDNTTGRKLIYISSIRSVVQLSDQEASRVQWLFANPKTTK